MVGTDDLTIRDLRMRAAELTSRWQARILEIFDLTIDIEVADFARDDQSAFAVRDTTLTNDYIIYLHPRSALLDERAFEKLLLFELIHIMRRRVADNDNLAAIEYLSHYITVLLLEHPNDSYSGPSR